MTNSTRNAIDRLHSSTTQSARRSQTDESINVSAEFRKLQQFIASKFTLPQVPAEPGNEPALFIARADDKKSILCAAEGYRQLVHRALSFSIHVETDADNEQRQNKLRKIAIRELRRHVPTFRYEQQDELPWDLHEKPAARIKRELMRELLGDLERMIEATYFHANAMQQENLFGYHQVSSQKAGVGWYTFRRVRIQQLRVDQKKSERSEVRETPENNLREEVKVTNVVNLHDQTLVFELHRHSYIGRHDYPWPASAVPQPRFVKEFITSIPAPWTHIIKIAAGYMPKESVQRTTRFTKRIEDTQKFEEVVRSGRLYSPTVHLGGTISLLGWSGDDVLQDREARKGGLFRRSS